MTKMADHLKSICQVDNALRRSIVIALCIAIVAPVNAALP